MVRATYSKQIKPQIILYISLWGGVVGGGGGWGGCLVHLEFKCLGVADVYSWYTLDVLPQSCSNIITRALKITTKYIDGWT